MSTRIHTIEAITFEPVENTIESREVKTDMYITRFYGGKHGPMLQLTMSHKDGYVQLTQVKIKELIKVLQNAFDYNKYPNE